jgi:PEP-CTERM motif
MGNLEIKNCVCGLAVVITLTFVTWASSATFAVPASNATTENPLPGEGFTGFLGTDPEISLIQIAGSELVAQGLDMGEAIIGVRGRADARFSGGPIVPSTPIAWSDFTLKLSQATNSISTMSTSYDANMTNPVLVRSGPYTLPTGSMPVGSSPNAFGPLIQFGTPYIYQGGDLCFYYSHSVATGQYFGQDGGNSYTGHGTLYRRLLGGPTTGFLTDELTVLQFEVVPEPSTLLLLGIGAISFLGYRQAKR